MNSAERRGLILKKLTESKNPIKGTDLAETFGVSRQVIVQDIALLRARGEEIIATPQGYIILTSINGKTRKRIVCKHKGYEAIEDELQIMIDYGVTIVDVIVEHPLYGEITSQLNISNKMDLDMFMDNIKKKKAEPLATLTDGIHIHTIEAYNEGNFEKLQRELDKKGYLIKD